MTIKQIEMYEGALADGDFDYAEYLLDKYAPEVV